MGLLGALSRRWVLTTTIHRMTRPGPEKWGGGRGQGREGFHFRTRTTVVTMQNPRVSFKVVRPRVTPPPGPHASRHQFDFTHPTRHCDATAGAEHAKLLGPCRRGLATRQSWTDTTGPNRVGGGWCFSYLKHRQGPPVGSSPPFFCFIQV